VVCLVFYVLATRILFAAQLPAALPQTGVAVGAVQGPFIELPETQFDFGEASEAGEVAHDFVVKNTGTEVLQIQQVRPG
jgi:hypothetical protein